MRGPQVRGYPSSSFRTIDSHFDSHSVFATRAKKHTCFLIQLDGLVDSCVAMLINNLNLDRIVPCFVASKSLKCQPLETATLDWVLDGDRMGQLTRTASWAGTDRGSCDALIRAVDERRPTYKVEQARLLKMEQDRQTEAMRKRSRPAEDDDGEENPNPGPGCKPSDFFSLWKRCLAQQISVQTGCLGNVTRPKSLFNAIQPRADI